MILATLALLTFTQAQDEAPRWGELDVLSGNGWYRAELRRVAGFERHPPERSRWRVRVVATADPTGEELWDAHYPYEGTMEGYVLSDDGRSFARVHESYQDYRAVMTVFRDGREVDPPSGSELGIPPREIVRTDAGKRWLAPGGLPAGTRWLETDEGPDPVLELTCVDEARRFVSLRDGRVWSPEDFDRLFTVRVEPPLPDRYAELVQTPFVREVVPPEVVRAGTAAGIEIQADHPTPGWRFEGFLLEQSGREGRDLRITPRSRGPVGGFTVQVLDPFRPTARLVGLVPGRYRVAVVGRATPDPAPVELHVVPADTLVVIRRSGGIAGIDEELVLLDRGELQVLREGESRSRYVSPEGRFNVRQLVDRIDERRSSRRSSRGQGADLLETRVTFWKDDLPITRILDETSFDGDATSLVRLVESFDE